MVAADNLIWVANLGNFATKRPLVADSGNMDLGTQIQLATMYRDRLKGWYRVARSFSLDVEN